MATTALSMLTKFTGKNVCLIDIKVLAKVNGYFNSIILTSV